MHNKLLFVVFALLLQVPNIFAQEEGPATAELTFVVDDAERVEISIAGDEISDIVTGSNTVEVAQWSNVMIAPRADCVLKSVVDSQGNELAIANDGSVTFMVYETIPETYTITSEKLSDVSFTINVDDPSKVAIVDKNYMPISGLIAGENILEMSPLNFPLSIGAASYGQEVYQVLFDGEEVSSYYGSYSVTPVEGSIITINANFPDIECSVDFTYPEGILEFFTAIYVNGKEVEMANNHLEVKCGDKITLHYNASCWDTEDNPIQVSINENPVKWFGSGYSFVVRENTTVSVEQAFAVEMITVTVEADKPGNVIVYRGNKEYYKDIIKLSDGQNIVELPKENANLVITNVEADGEESRITGITVNGTPKSVSYYNEVEVSDLDEGDVIKIFTEGNFVSGIQTVISGSSAEGVYNLFGVKVSDNTEHLPMGIYIVNGRKVIIR